MPDHYHARGGGAVDNTSSVDPTAFVGRDSSSPTDQIVGAGAYVGAGSWIGFGNNVGANTIIGQDCRIVGGTDIGESCNIANGVFIDTGAEIGDAVVIGPNVVIETGITVGDGARIGENNVIDANVAAGEVIPPIGGGSSAGMPGTLGRYLTRAIALSGIDSDHMQWFYDPMVASLQPIVTSPARVSSGGWIVNRTTTFGDSSGVGGFDGGVQQLSSTPGGGAPVFSAAAYNADGAAFIVGEEGAVRRWYFASHARIAAGSIEALQGGYSGIASANENVVLRMGVNGRQSITHFSLASGAFNSVDDGVTGTVAIDGEFHLFEMWCEDTNAINWAIDGVTQTPLAVFPDDLANCHPFLMTELDTTSIQSVFWEIDDVCMVFPDAEI